MAPFASSYHLLPGVGVYLTKDALAVGPQGLPLYLLRRVGPAGFVCALIVFIEHS